MVICSTYISNEVKIIQKIEMILSMTEEKR